MARAILLMTKVASPKTVREFQVVKEAITSWENKVVWRERLCHRCGGCGHMTRPGKSKGKGRDFGGYGGFKGKGKGVAKGGGDKGFGGLRKGGDMKGHGKGCQGTCWTCGAVGHKSSECSYHRPANAVEDDVGGAGSREVDIGA